METKVNYAAVGAFVLVLGAVFVAAILWLASSGGKGKQYEMYRAVVHESVSGLNRDAPVKYLGVDVGKVRDIRLDAKNPQEVQLTFAIERGTPIKSDTEAVLRTQGLTGIAYVELSGGSLASPPLKAEGSDEMPIIRTKPSLSARLENVMTNVLANVDRTAANINALIDSDNRDALKHILNDTAAVTRTIAEQNKAITATITAASKTATNAARASEKLGPLLERIQRSADSFDRVALAAERAATSADRTITAVGTGAERTLTAVNGSMRQISTQTLPEIDRTLGELSALTTSLRRLSEQVERSPSSVLRGRQLVAPGPGERPRP